MLATGQCQTSNPTANPCQSLSMRPGVANPVGCSPSTFFGSDKIRQNVQNERSAKERQEGAVHEPQLPQPDQPTFCGSHLNAGQVAASGDQGLLAAFPPQRQLSPTC